MNDLTPAEVSANATPVERKGRPISKTPRLLRGGWWEVELDNDRCAAFETKAQAARFIKSNGESW